MKHKRTALKYFRPTEKRERKCVQKETRENCAAFFPQRNKKARKKERKINLRYIGLISR